MAYCVISEYVYIRRRQKWGEQAIAIHNNKSRTTGAIHTKFYGYYVQVQVLLHAQCVDEDRNKTTHDIHGRPD